MTTNQVNYLNIGLMAISLVAAFMLPFEVFLFSYAFLGPLHYLTEISWLHDRKYFSPKRFDVVPLIIFTVLFTLGAGTMILGEDITNWLNEQGMEGVITFLGTYGYDITFISFGLALLFILTQKTQYRIIGAAIIMVAAYFFHAPELLDIEITNRAEYDRYINRMNERSMSPYFAAFAVYLPTLIHVYIFTGAFILFGALKRDSTSGYISFAFFIFCAASCFLLFTDTTSFGWAPGEWARTSYEGSNFGSLNQYLMVHFGGEDWFSVNEMRFQDEGFIYSNSMSILFARFIAFAYTYHYLNWFSKTSVIRWHKVPKLRFLAVIVLYLASIAVYLYDYALGFQWLFFLSFAHVVLEFPLNHQSFIGIGQELKNRINGQSNTPPPRRKTSNVRRKEPATAK